MLVSNVWFERGASMADPNETPRPRPTEAGGAAGAAHGEARAHEAAGRARGPTLAGVARAGTHPVVVIFLLSAIFAWLSGEHVQAWPLLAVAVALLVDLARGSPRPSAGPVPDRPGIEDAAGAADGAADAAAVGARVGIAPAGRRLGRGALVAAGILVYTSLVGAFARFSWPATLAVLVPGAAAVARAWDVTPSRRPAPGPLAFRGAAAWVAVFVAFAIWELAALLMQPTLTTDSFAHPTISVLMNPILAGHLGRSISMTVWLLLGWFLVTR